MLTHLSCTTAAFLYFVEKLRHPLAYKISIMLDSSSVGEVPGAFGGHLLLHNLSILLPHQKHRLFQQCTSNSLKKIFHPNPLRNCPIFMWKCLNCATLHNRCSKNQYKVPSSVNGNITWHCHTDGKCKPVTRFIYKVMRLMSCLLVEISK